MTDHWKPWDRNRPRDYEVGKYRPPKHSQFKRGQSDEDVVKAEKTSEDKKGA